MLKRKSPGLTYHKIDMHVHTPASSCFDDKLVTEHSIIKKAISEKLDAIAITDHNTGLWIDRIKQAAKDKLAVFPGVELSATGGKKGTVHIVGIFDRKKTTKDIENLLGDLGILPEKYGTKEAYTKLSPSDVIDKIALHGGLAILAHANSSQGVMGGMQGNPRIGIINNLNLLAAEATDFNSEDKKQKKNRVVDILSGSHHEFRKLAVYQSSDNLSSKEEGKHTLDAIGSNYTYFKLDDISLEGLRQCFCDPEVRIRLMNELKIRQYPTITRMEVSQGFLQKQNICYHKGLNSIVGGKGSGKSLVVEFLRFALNQPSYDKNILEDHKSKLEKRLESFGQVYVELELQNGEKYKVTRIYDAIDNRIECINMHTGEEYEGEIATLFPILAYSQNEVIRIAEDEGAQLKLIDSFIDISTHQGNIRRLGGELNKNDKELAESIRSAAEVSVLQKELKTIKEQLRNLDLSLKNKLFDEMRNLEQKKAEIEKYLTLHDVIVEQIGSLVGTFKEEISVPNVNKNFIDDPLLKEAKQTCEKSFDIVTGALAKAKAKITKNKQGLTEKYHIWMPIYEKKQKQYEKMLLKAGGDKKKLETERKKLEKRKTEIQAQLDRYQAKLDKLGSLRKTRESLLDELDQVYQSQFTLRKNKFDDITKQSNSKLQLTLTHATNRSVFGDELIALLRGSGIHKEVSNVIVQNLMPREFINIVIENDITGLENRADIDPINSKKVIDNLNLKEAFEDVLSLAHSCYPEDVPCIEYRKEDGKYYPITDLSVGQKCTALLIIALSEGTRPIIIDQPEDSLDTSSIYEDVVYKLRDSKEKRQFILTTHNSSVGVASDSDNFIVLRSTASQGTIECYGAIDKEAVKTEIIDHLEGGSKPYKLKSRKYNVKSRQ